MAQSSLCAFFGLIIGITGFAILSCLNLPDLFLDRSNTVVVLAIFIWGGAVTGAIIGSNQSDPNQRDSVS